MAYLYVIGLPFNFRKQTHFYLLICKVTLYYVTHPTYRTPRIWTSVDKVKHTYYTSVSKNICKNKHVCKYLYYIAVHVNANNISNISTSNLYFFAMQFTYTEL